MIMFLFVLMQKKTKSHEKNIRFQRYILLVVNKNSKER